MQTSLHKLAYRPDITTLCVIKFALLNDMLGCPISSNYLCRKLLHHFTFSSKRTAKIHPNPKPSVRLQK
jgi:hypothetical protein